MYPVCSAAVMLPETLSPILSQSLPEHRQRHRSETAKVLLCTAGNRALVLLCPAISAILSVRFAFVFILHLPVQPVIEVATINGDNNEANDFNLWVNPMRAILSTLLLLQQPQPHVPR